MIRLVRPRHPLASAPWLNPDGTARSAPIHAQGTNFAPARYRPDGGSWRFALNKFLPFIVGTSALFLSACASTDNGGNDVGPPPPAAHQVEGSTFKILTVNGKPALRNVDADIRFEGGRISGTAGCNRLSGAFTQSGNVLSISGVGVTMMACPPAQMSQERDVLDILTSGATVTRHSDGRVSIRGPKGGVLELSRSF